MVGGVGAGAGVVTGAGGGTFGFGLVSVFFLGVVEGSIGCCCCCGGGVGRIEDIPSFFGIGSSSYFA